MFVPKSKLYPWDLRGIVREFKIIGQGFVGTLIKFLNRLSGMDNFSSELGFVSFMINPKGLSWLSKITEF
jgi:hypothetical protein